MDSGFYLLLQLSPEPYTDAQMSPSVASIKSPRSRIIGRWVPNTIHIIVFGPLYPLNPVASITAVESQLYGSPPQNDCSQRSTGFRVVRSVGTLRTQNYPCMVDMYDEGRTDGGVFLMLLSYAAAEYFHHAKTYSPSRPRQR